MSTNHSSKSSQLPNIGRLPIPSYHGNEPYIYVCYSHRDHQAAFEEIWRFYKAGLHVCYDEGILPSGELPKELADMISNCSLFVALITPDAVHNVQFCNQIFFALHEDLPILQIYLEKTESPLRLELELGARQAIIKENMSDEEYEYRLLQSFHSLGLDYRFEPEEKHIADAESALPQSKSRRHRGGSGWVSPPPTVDHPSSEKKPGFFSSLFSRKNKKAPVALSEVQFSAVAPESLKRSEYSIIDVMMYEQDFRHTVDELIAQSDTKRKETKSGVVKVKHASVVSVILSSPDIAIDDDDQKQQWNGGYLRFQFAVTLPDDYAKKQVLFNADIYINGVIATKLKFTMMTDALSQQKLDVTRTDILSAFVSYASQDRSRVAAVIQGMSKARPDLDIFFDIESLRSGENWEKILTQEIDKRDLLFLCWSENAKNSEWVDYEWRYAYKQKGIECIEPVPLESPEKCPPPKELSVKHFNDKLLYIINSSIT